MSFLAKLNLKTVSRVVNKDPILQRRDKLAAGIDEQGRVLEARMRGEEFTVTKQRWATNDEFVDKLDEVAAVLAAFGDAAKSGELDKAVLLATEAKG
jgi:hypothetical protein